MLLPMLADSGASAQTFSCLDVLARGPTSCPHVPMVVV